MLEVWHIKKLWILHDAGGAYINNYNFKMHKVSGKTTSIAEIYFTAMEG